MTWLYEDPWTVLMVCVLIGVGVEIVCGQIGQHAMFLGLLGMLVFTGSLLAVEHFVVTDREMVENAVHGAAASMASGDYAQVQQFLVDHPTTVHSQAEGWLSRYRVRRVKCTDLKIEINRLTVPPTAHVELWAHAELEPGASFGGMTGPFHPRVTLDLEWEDDRWKISGADVLRD
jgi:hypothetical protein